MKYYFLLLAALFCSTASMAQSDNITSENREATRLFESKKYPEAIQLYKKAAAKGDLDAMEMLIDIYSEGIGVPANPKLAKQWGEKMEKAIKKAEQDEEKLPYNNERGHEPN